MHTCLFHYQGINAPSPFSRGITDRLPIDRFEIDGRLLYVVCVCVQLTASLSLFSPLSLEARKRERVRGDSTAASSAFLLFHSASFSWREKKEPAMPLPFTEEELCCYFKRKEEIDREGREEIEGRRLRLCFCFPPLSPTHPHQSPHHTFHLRERRFLEVRMTCGSLPTCLPLPCAEEPLFFSCHVLVGTRNGS